MMDDMEDYSGQTEEVLSGLRNAVGDADEKLLKLQKELDLLERKAQEGQGLAEFDNLMSGSSDMDDDDISKYLEECSQNTTINDSVLNSVRSSASLDAAAASTKLFETTPVPYAMEQHQKCFTPPSKSEGNKKVSKTPSDESSTVKNVTEMPSNNGFAEERWGHLKRVLSEDKSAGTVARDEMFKQILQATEKKYPHCPKQKPDAVTRSMNLSMPVTTPLAPVYTSSYDTLFSEREIVKERMNKSKPVKRQKNVFLISEMQNDDNDHHFRPIQSIEQSDKHDLQALRKTSEEAMAENERLQNLLEEEKKKNDELSDKVSSLEKDLEEIRCKFELKSHEDTTGKISAVVDEIQKAQKLREKAMMNRLQIAARDRDEALMRVRAMHLKNLHTQKLEKLGHKDKSDKTLMDLVEKIAMADSARIIEKYGNELVERMNNLKNAQARITAEEMAAVIKERDDAIAKCHALQQDLQNCIEELNNSKRSQNTSVNTTLKAKVLSTQEERDQTRAKLHDAEEEIQMLRIYYSLHKSLTLVQDKDLAEKYNQYLEGIRVEAVKRAEQAKKMEAENLQLQEQLRTTVNKNHQLDGENAKLTQETQYLKEKCAKFERLVKVLRRKLVSQIQGTDAHT